MCKELPFILVNKVVVPKTIIGKKWRAEEEERHKGSLTQKKKKIYYMYIKSERCTRVCTYIPNSK
jgi:hypothetical protein